MVIKYANKCSKRDAKKHALSASVRLSNMTIIIATMNSWKLFSILVLSAILMIALMPFYGIGFFVGAAAIFGWLYSISSELAKKNGKSVTRSKLLSLVGITSTVIFILSPHLKKLGVNTPLELIIAPVGIVLLGSMMYLMTDISSLLTDAEREAKQKVNAFVLVWLWPVGVWFLQPRLQRVLAK